ncbi:hypothetical protein [Streptomyces formicae]
MTGAAVSATAEIAELTGMANSGIEAEADRLYEVLRRDCLNRLPQFEAVFG